MSQPDSTNILTRVTDAVSSTGMTAEGFASAAGIAPDRLTDILNGDRAASSLDVALIAETAAVTVEWLLTGQPEPTIFVCSIA